MRGGGSSSGALVVVLVGGARVLSSRRLEAFALPFAGRGLRSSKGRLGLWTPGHAIVVARFSGQGDKAFVAPIVEAFASALKTVARAHIFFDAEAMSSYDSELRTGLTAAFLEERAKIAELHVLSASKLTAMGVSVANLALGGIITSHHERAPFARSLDTRLAAARVLDFSSNTL
jgi:hypothetical protein